MEKEVLNDTWMTTGELLGVSRGRIFEMFNNHLLCLGEQRGNHPELIYVVCGQYVKRGRRTFPEYKIMATLFALALVANSEKNAIALQQYMSAPWSDES
jgi:hypothetical protein